MLHRFCAPTTRRQFRQYSLSYHGFATPSITVPSSQFERVFINPATMRKIALSIAHEQTKQKEHPNIKIEKIPNYPTLMQYFNQPNRKCYITPAVYNDYKDYYPEEAIPKKLFFIFSKLSGLTLEHTLEQLYKNLQWTPEQITPEIQSELMYLIEASYRFPDDYKKKAVEQNELYYLTHSEFLMKQIYENEVNKQLIDDTLSMCGIPNRIIPALYIGDIEKEEI